MYVYIHMILMSQVEQAKKRALKKCTNILNMHNSLLQAFSQCLQQNNSNQHHILLWLPSNVIHMYLMTDGMIGTIQ